MLGDTGDYIGVTATPARLDLNNTFDNDSGRWVRFPAHDHYTGQDIFFPFDNVGLITPLKRFRLTLLPEKGDDPRFARAALFRFLVSVAYLNIHNNKQEENYSILIHTSGNKADHRNDWQTMQDALAALIDRESTKFETYVREIWTVAQERYPEADPDDLTLYVVSNSNRNSVIVLNSDSDFRQNGSSATSPSALFTIVIGGNIVSRGVTFDNLLSMFFTRDVKHRIQQDTYIQRARMFGSRGAYLRFFELTIPKQLYLDWHRCFVFHRLSLASIIEGKGSPVWLSDNRIAAVAAASIDKSTVDVDRGEMAFSLFDYTTGVEEAVSARTSVSEKLDNLSSILGDNAFPAYLRRFILQSSISIETAVAILPTAGLFPSMTAEEKVAISRSKGMMGATQTKGNAQHYLKIFKNDEGLGRLYYKYMGSIHFAKNLK